MTATKYTRPRGARATLFALLAVLALFANANPADAQKRCTKGEPCPSDDPDWTNIHSDRIYDYYVHVPTVQNTNAFLGRFGPAIVTVHLMSFAARELAYERVSVMAARAKEKQTIEGYEHFLYSMNYWEIRCKDQLVSLDATADFDTEGKKLAEGNFNREWIQLSRFEPRSAVQPMFHWTCRDGN